MENLTLTPDYELDLSDLTRPVESVSPDFTLLDLVRIVFEAERRWPGIAAAFDMENIDAFYAEASGDRDADDDGDVHYLELYWSFDRDAETIKGARRRNRRRRKGTPRVPDVRESATRGEMPNIMSFHGVGKHWDDENICDDPENCQHHNLYGVWLTPLNNLAHLPIRMDTEAKVYPPFETWSLVRKAARRLGRSLHRQWERKLSTPELTIDIKPTLHTFLSSVLWEMTFAGPHPDDRQAKSEELERSSEEVKEGKVKTIGLDELLDRLDDEIDADE